jgi:LysR family glycine cleavage system transcriptional activator
MRIGGKHLPLNALQGFEAAGRHLNMRAAGEELNVTQSAISHQVRSVERALGKPLFEANRRRLVLTPQEDREDHRRQGGEEGDNRKKVIH